MSCCTRAVHDSTAGWWCPVHGDGENRAAEIDWLEDLAEMAQNAARHEGHTRVQVGPCVYCSCGKRYQGTL
jgi:hypothetical protein